MSLLAGLKTSKDIAEDKDILGGNYKVLDSDIYTGKIKYAYLQKAANSNAMSLNLSVIIDGTEYKETLWISNKNGQNFYEKDGKKNYLPSFTIANNIALFTAQKELADLDTEEKVVNIYNYDQKKEVPTAMPCITAFHDKKVTLAIMKEIKPKQAKNDAGIYVDTNETREVNTIQKVFHPENHKTVAECKAKADHAEFYDKWLEQNKGKVKEHKAKSATPGASTNQSKTVSSLFA